MDQLRSRRSARGLKDELEDRLEVRLNYRLEVRLEVRLNYRLEVRLVMLLVMLTGEELAVSDQGWRRRLQALTGGWRWSHLDSDIFQS